jgi:hypothetical protein
MLVVACMLSFAPSVNCEIAPAALFELVTDTVPSQGAYVAQMTPSNDVRVEMAVTITALPSENWVNFFNVGNRQPAVFVHACATDPACEYGGFTINCGARTVQTSPITLNKVLHLVFEVIGSLMRVYQDGVMVHEDTSYPARNFATTPQNLFISEANNVPANTAAVAVIHSLKIYVPVQTPSVAEVNALVISSNGVLQGRVTAIEAWIGTLGANFSSPVAAHRGPPALAINDMGTLTPSGDALAMMLLLLGGFLMGVAALATAGGVVYCYCSRASKARGYAVADTTSQA